jgi:hypothetical protein
MDGPDRQVPLLCIRNKVCKIHFALTPFDNLIGCFHDAMGEQYT